MWLAGLGRSLLAQPALCSFMGPQWILQVCSWLKQRQLCRIESCPGLCSFTTLVPLALDSSFMTVNVVPFVWTSSFFRAFQYPVTSLSTVPGQNTPLLIDGVTRIQARSQHEWQKPGILWGVSRVLNKA
uniref:Secreted protein n=1 Tax=Colobus angolensis palliatus TaxID=336983 RepID=A0A2K5K9P0_COLAP